MNQEQSLRKVFISYRWEGQSHEDKVIRLANQLLQNGIDCQLDKRKDALTKENINWSAWVDKELPNAEFILAICTKSYKNCFDDDETCTGKGGVQYEANLIRQKVLAYNILPIIFNINDNEHIPDCIKSVVSYELFETEFNVYEEKSGYCSLFRKITAQPRHKFSELGQVPALPPINEETILNEYSKEMNNQYQFVIDYLNSNEIHQDNLIEVCKKYLEKIYVDVLMKYKTLDNIINHISSYKEFPCIVKELYQEDDEKLKFWLDNEDLVSCLKIETIDETPRAVIIFTSRHDAQKYNVTFISKNLPNILDAKSDEDYDLADAESKKKLIENIMSYVQYADPKVDLILPNELLVENINLWKVKRNSIGQLSRLNIRDIKRYNIGDNIKKVIIDQWNKVLTKISQKQNLRCIEDESDLDFIGNNLDECGIASKYILKIDDLESLLQTEMSYIMLWFTKECEIDLSRLYTTDISNLQNEYFKLQNSPINLMWDDPTTYYYPDEIQGESNE